MSGVVSWLGAWLLFIVLLVVLSKTLWGKTVVYYVLWLCILLLVVTRSNEIAGLFNAGNIGQPQQNIIQGGTIQATPGG